jgi:hypothetical protein
MFKMDRLLQLENAGNKNFFFIIVIKNIILTVNALFSYFTPGATRLGGTAYPSGTPEFTTQFLLRFVLLDL